MKFTVKSVFSPLVVTLSLWGCANASNQSTYQSSFSGLNKTIMKQTGYAPLIPVQLEFARFLKVLADQKTLSQHQFKRWYQDLESLSPTNTCELVQHKNMQLQLSLMQERNELIKDGIPEYRGSFFEMENGQRWYRHWLKSWLLDDVELTVLQDIARSELALVNAHSLELEKRKASNSLDLRQKLFSESDHREIVAEFRKREKMVMAQLSSLLDIQQPVPRVSIKDSNLPKSFPAPGLYNSFSQTFIYHMRNDVFEERYLDWLYLHEGAPGHHLQHIVTKNEPICSSYSGFPEPMVMTEGWAAYIETIGEKFGLLTEPESKAYALEWRKLRAIRVLVDVGIHSLGWSDEQAYQLWRQFWPDSDDIMQREVARIKRWPAQVISYVYGKHLIESAVNRAASYKSKPSDKEILTAVLKLTNQPGHALRFIDHVINSASIQKES